jgi:putative tricarboxylic transport membrane protein
VPTRGRVPIQDMVLGGVLLAIGLGLYLAAAQLQGGSPTDPLGPRGFPSLLSLGFVGSGVALLVKSVLVARNPEAHVEEPDDDEEEEPLMLSRLLLASLGIIVYVIALLPVLGFLLATVVFVAAMISVQGGAARRPFIVMSLGFPIAVYVLFGVLLDVSLPIGMFFVDPIDLFTSR